MQIKTIKKIILLTSLSILAQSSYAQFYRWVDENGKVHYSDKLPPERARGAHDQLNDDGVSTRSVDRDKTSKEREAEKVEAAKLAAERKEKAATEARQRAKDKILLDTFTSERDLIYTRDDRLTAIESLINLAKLNNKRLEERLTVSLATQDRLEKSNRPVPENIVDKIKSMQNQIDKNNAYITLQQATYNRIDAEFAADLIRYRELKGVSASTVEVPEDKSVLPSKR